MIVQGMKPLSLLSLRVISQCTKLASWRWLISSMFRSFSQRAKRTSASGFARRSCDLVSDRLKYIPFRGAPVGTLPASLLGFACRLEVLRQGGVQLLGVCRLEVEDDHPCWVESRLQREGELAFVVRLTGINERHLDRLDVVRHAAILHSRVGECNHHHRSQVDSEGALKHSPYHNSGSCCIRRVTRFR